VPARDVSAGALVGLAGFGVYVAAVLVLQRIVRGKAALVATGAAVAFYLIAALAALGAGWRFNFWEYTAVYSFFTLAFLMVFGAVYKSVSLRMLEFLLEQPGRSAPAEILRQRYVATGSFTHRLQVIEDARFARRGPEGFALTAKGRALARAVHGLHALFAIERIG
jgi:hypothetical protein